LDVALHAALEGIAEDETVPQASRAEAGRHLEPARA
jgi:hypothetical protein